MMPGDHMLFGIIFALGISLVIPQLLSPLWIIVIFLSSIFIDVDHYFASVKAGRGWSLGKAYKWYCTRNRTTKDFVDKSFIPLHSLEFLIGLLLLYILSMSNGYILLGSFLLSIFLGCGFHIVLDLVVIIYNKEDLYIKTSFIYTYFQNKKLLEKSKRNEKTKRFKY
jgi:hypothetical protein